MTIHYIAYLAYTNANEIETIYQDDLKKHLLSTRNTYCTRNLSRLYENNMTLNFLSGSQLIKNIHKIPFFYVNEPLIKLESHRISGQMLRLYRPMLLKLECIRIPLEVLLKHCVLGPNPRSSDSLGPK